MRYACLLRISGEDTELGGDSGIADEIELFEESRVSSESGILEYKSLTECDALRLTTAEFLLDTMGASFGASNIKEL